MKRAGLPLFHLYGDPPDDQAFDFVHIESISSRSSVNDWTITPHRHRNLFQLMLIEQGGGILDLEADSISFEAPSIILLAPTVAHGFRFKPRVTDGFVINFTEDVTSALGEQAGVALARLKHIAAQPLLPVAKPETARFAAICRDLIEEQSLGREGFELASRALLALLGVEVARLYASQARSGTITLAPADATVEELRRLIEENFRSQRQIGFYASKLAMTADRLNDHVKRATGVTAGHLLRQRLLTEAKRQLVFTDLSIGEVAYDLAFADPSHFARFFKKQTGTTPQAFRESSLRMRANTH
ncbi:MAG: helix-turn-helix domain-containing protein [Xanthobacteraceae bacterium]|nr:helix-turn-helix domain-containing protein [Xanthobacteraceae bacterium]QYK44014.1 MAG: helix-turn-helix domain-containing protein [Xanthobacteraceae bacterium]